MKSFLPVICWATSVEIYGAICRLHHEKLITDPEKQGAVTRLQRLGLAWREILPDDHVRDLALACLDKYPLRAADALQLAASLTWCQRRPANRTFITADFRLGQAAESSGFSVQLLV
ncbi:MAG TPA: type II toxin-antitoxin system VapC family toxin [Candidatus Acidoferrum sp.]|nr:type II toxin-antitoxin system VapC family toxin [Candidatus Acidoferrum sp.]